MSVLNPKNYLDHAQKIEKALLDVPVGHPLRDLLEDASKMLTHAADGRCSDTAHDNTRVALIDKGYHWTDIDRSTPRGSKMQLINRNYGVAIYGTIGGHEKFFTHWAPLPTFKN
ncbi:hypothetical protein WJ96_07710 [Burkholderia ubonensis]|uniref:DUF551 domain-containing protein n=1 Tax=Burkholderia ubonensis TaxID=101571 RepID=A0AAW3MWV4_9BURK|nr:hypothetical protein [Burkholderia ubonensis]KVP75586.1 hypothetical protein WJ93_09510 [Burkholderia ubonensis]KVP98398.1 hypothetical protein WJ96_07710 [Burkholderia ubonensis]KVZ93097.1 hypothetical protein WL25_19375 [Burkholderia ubonensis]